MIKRKGKKKATAADSNGFAPAAVNCNFINCEGVSYRGDAISLNQVCTIYGGYYHDSNIGIHSAVSGWTVDGAILASNVTNAFNDFLAHVYGVIKNCTFYGAEAKLGVGMNLLTAALLRTVFINNIVYGFVSDIVFDTTSNQVYDDFNCYFNNTNAVDTALWAKGANNVYTDPGFINVQQRTGSTATTGASNTLTQSGATFTTWGVTAGTHYLRIISGTGVTAGIYGILSVDSETQLTTDITLTADATADKTWAICTGLNWAVGTNMKAQGFPETFPGASTTPYVDIGAAQRLEAGINYSRIFGGF